MCDLDSPCWLGEVKRRSFCYVSGHAPKHCVFHFIHRVLTATLHWGWCVIWILHVDSERWSEEALARWVDMPPKHFLFHFLDRVLMATLHWGWCVIWILHVDSERWSEEAFATWMDMPPNILFFISYKESWRRHPTGADEWSGFSTLTQRGGVKMLLLGEWTCPPNIFFFIS